MPRTAQSAGFGDSQKAALPGSSNFRQSLTTSEATFGGTQAKQMQQTSKSLDAVSDQLGQMEIRNQAAEAADLNTQMQREAMDLQYNPTSGFFAQKGGDALQLREDAEKKMDALAAKYQEKATSAGAASAFSKSFGTYRNSVMEGVTKYQLAQSQSYVKDMADSRKSLNAEKAGLQYNDDKAFGSFLADNTSAVTAQASQEGWPAAKFHEELWKSNSALYKSRAYSMMNNQDPNVVIQGAQFYQGAVERGDLTMEDVKALDSMRDAAYPRALATQAVAGFRQRSLGFGDMSIDQIFDDGLIKQESGGRQFAGPGVPLTSSAGAIGIAQVMPGTGPEAAKLAGVPWDEAKYKNDAVYNASLGKAYLKAQTAKYGDSVLALTAYNWGPGNVDNHIKKLGDPSKGEVSYERFMATIPSKEAREYVPRIRAKLGLDNDGSQIIDAAAAQAKAAELDLKYPGAGAEFLATVGKQNKVIEDATKAANDKLITQGASYMQATNGDITSVPPALKAQLIQAGKWDDVAKYTGVSNRNAVVKLDTMTDEDFAQVDLSKYTLDLSAGDMEQRTARQRKIRGGDEGYSTFRTQGDEYWMAIAGKDAGKSSEDKALFRQKSDEAFDAFVKTNKHAPTREEARVIYQGLSLKLDIGGRAYEAPREALYSVEGIPKADVDRYTSVLTTFGRDVNEDNLALLRRKPEMIVGEVPGVPSEKLLPIIDSMVRARVPITPASIADVYKLKNDMSGGKDKAPVLPPLPPLPKAVAQTASNDNSGIDTAAFPRL